MIFANESSVKLLSGIAIGAVVVTLVIAIFTIGIVALSSFGRRHFIEHSTNQVCAGLAQSF